MPSATIAPAAPSAATSMPAPPRNATSPRGTMPAPPAAPTPRATDDEILGIVSPRKNPTRNADQLEFDFDAAHSSRGVIPPALRNEGSEASAASSFGPVHPVRADAQSRNLSSADHVAQSAANDAAAQNQNRWQDAGATAANDAQLAFLNAANAAAVEGVVAAIESQVERLLPEGVAKNARTRVVGEIYRELDATLRSNPQFAAQLRDAFRSGSLDEGHQRAIVSLLTGRARQALPGVAKRVLNEWTSTIVSAAHERRTRQRTAERRVDIAGSGGAGNDGRRSMSPRDLDYARLTDADILNL
jgi:hypothetical protein